MPNDGNAFNGKREWSGAGSNRRHMDFQSIALPTELPDQQSTRNFPIDQTEKCSSWVRELSIDNHKIERITPMFVIIWADRGTLTFENGEFTIEFAV